jgi:CHAD domain-containing protein
MGPSSKWITAIDPSASVDAAARVSLEARLTAVAHHLPLAAYHTEQDSEHVHRLRVSTRRAAAALDLYRDWLPRKRARWIEKRLKKIRRAAGQARDLDVLAERLARDYGDRAEAVASIVAQERDSVQVDIVRIAEKSRRDDRFVRKTARLIHSVRLPQDAQAVNSMQTFRAWAAEKLADVAGQFFDAVPVATADMEALHRFRIQAKSLRYAMELLASAFGPELREIQYPVVEELQERLGRINDHVAARDCLRKWAADDKFSAQQCLLCELAEDELVLLADELSEFREWWTPSIAEQLSHKLAHSA